MRISKLVLPIAAALAGAAAATASAASPVLPPVHTGYVWGQPGTALQASPYAQMPSWIVTAPKVWTIDRLPVLRSYHWAQPGSAPVHVKYGQPWSL